MDRARVEVVPLARDHLDAWTRLFETSSCACYCRYWHFEGDKNSWLARCAQDPEANRREQTALVMSDDLRARGLVAMRNEECVGWLKLTPRASVHKLRRLPVYRSLDLGPDEGVWSIGCLLVRPTDRKTGVANALISAAPQHARAWGASSLEAYPHVQVHSEPYVADEQMWRGVITSYLSAGFVEVSGEQPYPVLRHPLWC